MLPRRLFRNILQQDLSCPSAAPGGSHTLIRPESNCAKVGPASVKNSTALSCETMSTPAKSSCEMPTSRSEPDVAGFEVAALQPTVAITTRTQPKTMVQQRFLPVRSRQRHSQPQEPKLRRAAAPLLRPNFDGAESRPLPSCG